MTLTRALLLAAGLALSPLPVGGGTARAQSAEVEAALRETHRVWGVPPGTLRCLCRRESTFNPLALNPAGPYLGIVQWDLPTWNYAKRTLRNPAAPAWPLLPAHASPYQPRAALLAAGGLIARGEGWRWPPLRWCGGHWA